MINLSDNLIKEIVESYGEAVYIFNQEEFENNYRELVETFRKVYPNYHLCYSFKTNYTPTICKCVKDLGGYAEVVSDMEYELALKIGYIPQCIVFNGPIKGKYLKSHILSGGINNIDRIEEAEYICSLAKENPHLKLKTGIRVNFDIDAGYTSRFGIDVEKLGVVISLLKESNIEINGLHCHMSRARGIEPWKLRAKAMIEIIDEFKLHTIEYVSLGSGMYGKMDPELQMQFPIDAPTYEEYADAVLKQFDLYFENYKQKPIVFTEPGTTVVSKYIDFLGKVIGIKEVRGTEFILCNCSFHNLGETCQMKNLPITLFDGGGEKVTVTNAKLVGYTCLEQDVVYNGFSGKIALGDMVLFGNVGGYSIVDKPPFILPNYPMITVQNGLIREIKKKESFDDIFSTFYFGERK